eukprot:IDg21512t1
MASDEDEIREGPLRENDYDFYEDRQGRQKSANEPIQRPTEPTAQYSQSNRGSECPPASFRALIPGCFWNWPRSANDSLDDFRLRGDPNLATVMSPSLGRGSPYATAGLVTGTITPFCMAYLGMTIQGFQPHGFGMSNMGIHPSMVVGKVAQLPSGSSYMGSDSTSVHSGTPGSSSQRGLTRTFMLNVLSRPSGWHLVEQDFPKQFRGPFYVPPADIRCDRVAQEIGGTWYFAPSYFKDLPYMSKLWIFLVVFGPWVSDAIYRDPENVRSYHLDNGFYPGGSQIAQEFVSSFSISATFVSPLPSGSDLLDFCESWVLRDLRELSYVLEVRRLFDSHNGSGPNSGDIDIEGEFICPDVSIRRDFRVISRGHH